MSDIVLANADYRQHVTDEGDQLQRGLEAAGWTLAGHGYGDGCKDVPTLLDRHNPARVFVQDPRDWCANSPGAYNPAVAFTGIEALADHPAVKIVPVKDAGTAVRYQQEFAETIRATVAVTYYHDRSVLPLSPWLSGVLRVRTYHSVDAPTCRETAFLPGHTRRRGCVSGAVSDVYPLRRLAFAHAKALGINCLPHPGYGNRGCHTPAYLAALACFRVHVATSSRYGFALRKIVESVAVGCTPVTDLPEWDILPEIDAALVRVPQGATASELRDAIADADRAWDEDDRRWHASRAQEFYDWRAVGQRLSDAIMEVTQ